MDSSSGTTLAIAPASTPVGWMITARSHLINRMVAECEEIRLPETSVGGGTVSWCRGNIAAAPPEPRGRLRRLGRGLNPPVRRAEAGVLIDLRWHSPENWAHFLTNHLPLSFTLADRAGVAPHDLRPILPARTPAHILRMSNLFGLQPLTTGDVVEGTGIAFEVTPWTALRACRVDWVRAAPARAALAAAGFHGPPDSPLPARVFLSRRDTRRVVNEAEIADRLAARGFETVYPEDLSVLDQIRLLDRAQEIVAVHGAGLAPLLYRSADAPPARIVELFPCGHVTGVWRLLAAQVGCAWIGVRGRIRPEHVRPAYDLDRAFLKYSLQDFEVDPASLDRAFEILDGG